MLKVVVIDDSLAIQHSLGHLLQSIPDVELAGFAAEVADARRVIDSVGPDVVVLDLNLNGRGQGMGLLQHVRQRLPLAKVVVLTSVAAAAFTRLLNSRMMPR